MGRNKRCNKLVEEEIVKMRSILLNANTENSGRKSLHWTDFTTKRARKSILIGVVFGILSMCNGVVAMSNYITLIFQDTGSNLSPNMSSIFVHAIQVVAIFIGTLLVDRAGRKVS